MRIQDTPIILLAAGASTRMGHPKGLLRVDNDPWFIHQIKTFARMGGRDVFLVLGFQKELYQAELAKHENLCINQAGVSRITIHQVVNENPQRGAFSSMQTSFRAVVKAGFHSAILLPVDVPLAGCDTITRLLVNFSPSAYVALPQSHGISGHPVLLSQNMMKLCIGLDPSEGRLDHVIRGLDEKLIQRFNVNDKQVLYNLNTPMEWEHYWSTDHSKLD